MSLSAAFNLMLRLKSRTMTLTRPGGIDVTLRMSPTNYARNLSGPSESVIEGKEFIVSKAELDGSGYYPKIKRGDIITDADSGDETISYVDELYDIGGAIIGYRLRTS